MARIKRERAQQYEGKLEDREIEVYNHDNLMLLNRQKEAAEIWANE